MTAHPASRPEERHASSPRSASWPPDASCSASSPPVPIVIGGKGDAAVRRAARYGDGWLAIFCSARRFAQTKEQIAEAAADLGRPVPSWYGVNVWCGLDADAAQARSLLARQMEGLYHLPFGREQQERRWCSLRHGGRAAWCRARLPGAGCSRWTSGS